jgi:hypothetical protein
MMLEAAMITAIAAPTVPCMVPSTTKAPTITCPDTGIAEADSADGDGASLSYSELALR